MSTHTHTTAGIDVGSSSVKVAIAKSDAGNNGVMLALANQRIRRRNVKAVVEAPFAEASATAGVGKADMDYIASTGDADEIDFATGHFYGMTTHSRGAIFLHPEARAVLDIGALHARAIRINEIGRVMQQRMTSQCASGSGQFLENIARYLGVPLEDVSHMSLHSETPEECSSICAVLAETDVINMVSRGIATDDILKGIHMSIARRLTGLLRAIKADGTVLLTGGLAHDEGLIAALNEMFDTAKSKGRGKQLEVEVKTHSDAMYAGAIGGALLAAYRHQQLKELGRLEVLAAN